MIKLTCYFQETICQEKYWFSSRLQKKQKRQQWNITLLLITNIFALVGFSFYSVFKQLKNKNYQKMKLNEVYVIFYFLVTNFTYAKLIHYEKEDIMALSWFPTNVINDVRYI